LEDKISAVERWVPMHYPWQNGSRKNCISKVASLQQNDIWAWTIAHYPHGYDNAWTHRWEICIIFQWVVATWSQFHNWVLVAAFANVGGGSNFKVEILFEHPPHNSFFARLLQGKSCWVCKLQTPNQTIGVKPLLSKFVTSNG